MPRLFAKLSADGARGTLREALDRDLLALVNAALRGARWRGSPRAPAAESVLNYGAPPLAAFGASRIALDTLADGIRTTVQRFEPRLRPQTIAVRAWLARAGVDPAHPSAQCPMFEVAGELRAPPEAYTLRLRLDITHGHASLDTRSLV